VLDPDLVAGGDLEGAVSDPESRISTSEQKDNADSTRSSSRSPLSTISTAETGGGGISIMMVARRLSVLLPRLAGGCGVGSHQRTRHGE
jgi:hypothetical protein